MLRSITLTLLTSAAFNALHADLHLGPVTDIQVAGSRVFSVSQAGIIEGLGEDAHVVRKPNHRITSLSPHGELLYQAGGEPGRSGCFGSGPMNPPHVVSVAEIAKDLLYDIATSPRSGLIAVAAADGRILTLDVGSKNPSWRETHRHTAAARVVAFSPDGKWLASAGLDGVVLLSEVEADPPRPPLQLLDHTAGVECLVFSPGSRFLASGSRDSKVRLHEVAGKLVRTYNALGMDHEPVAGRVSARVLSLAWNKSTLLAGTSLGTLHELSREDDTVTTLPAPTEGPIYSLAFALDGQVLLGTQSCLETRPMP